MGKRSTRDDVIAGGDDDASDNDHDDDDEDRIPFVWEFGCVREMRARTISFSLKLRPTPAPACYSSRTASSSSPSPSSSWSSWSIRAISDFTGGLSDGPDREDFINTLVSNFDMTSWHNPYHPHNHYHNHKKKSKTKTKDKVHIMWICFIIFILKQSFSLQITFNFSESFLDF